MQSCRAFAAPEWAAPAAGESTTSTERTLASPGEHRRNPVGGRHRRAQPPAGDRPVVRGAPGERAHAVRRRPARRAVEYHAEHHLERDDWRIRVDGHTSMSADAEAFTVTTDRDAYEGDVRVHALRRAVRIPRNGGLTALSPLPLWHDCGRQRRQQPAMQRPCTALCGVTLRDVLRFGESRQARVQLIFAPERPPQGAVGAAVVTLLVDVVAVHVCAQAACAPQRRHAQAAASNVASASGTRALCDRTRAANATRRRRRAGSRGRYATGEHPGQRSTHRRFGASARGPRSPSLGRP